MHHQQLAIMQQKKGLITIKPYYLPKTRRKAFKTSQSLIDRMSLTSIVTLCHLSLSIMGDVVANGQFIRLQIERSGFKTWPGHCIMVFAKHFTFTVPFSTKECKWVAVNRQGGPLRGEVISSSWMGLLAQEQTLHYHCQTMLLLYYNTLCYPCDCRSLK